MGMFVPVYVETLHGVRSVDPGLIEIGGVYGMMPVGLFRRVIRSGALPAVFVVVRYALGIIWLILIVAETIATARAAAKRGRIFSFGIRSTRIRDRLPASGLRSVRSFRRATRLRRAA